MLASLLLHMTPGCSVAATELAGSFRGLPFFLGAIATSELPSFSGFAISKVKSSGGFDVSEVNDWLLFMMVTGDL